MTKSVEYQARLKAPFGVLGIACDEHVLTGIDFLPPDTTEMSPVNILATEVCAQLNEYFTNPDYQFTVPCKLQGTPFQQRVWEGMRNIRCGQTKTYGELAKSLASAPRAVGQACGANPIPIIVPCHRVVSKRGLGGFANHSAGYTLDIKRWLLGHELAGQSWCGN